MKLLYLWIMEDEKGILVNQGFNLGGRYHFEYQLENNILFINNKKNYIEDLYNLNDDLKYGVKDITAIIGANGTGKSTIINLIKDNFSWEHTFKIGKSVFENGCILVIENEDQNLITIFYGGNISNKPLIDVKDDIDHNIYDEKVSYTKNNTLNILRKNFSINSGNYQSKSIYIDGLNNIKTIYFSNVTDYFSGGNSTVNRDAKLYDISMNGLIKNDIENINIYSKVNVLEAIRRKLNIDQIEVFKKYENIRMLDFLTDNIEFTLPFKVPNEISLQFFDFRTYNYEWKDEYKIIHKVKPNIMKKLGSNKVGYRKRLFIISILLFLIQEIIDSIPHIEYADKKFLSICI